MGLILRDQLVLVEAARAGAREAAVSGADADVREAVGRAASTLNAEALSIRVERGGGVGDPVGVTLTYSDPVRVGAVAWLFPSTVTLTARATMRQEFG